jgi:3-oxoacyl-(acyl-carrier-protein) synthase III
MLVSVSDAVVRRSSRDDRVKPFAAPGGLSDDVSVAPLTRQQPCRIAGTGVAFPEPPTGVGALDNREVVASQAAMGRRGARSPEEIDELAAGLESTLGIRRRHWAHAVGQPFAADEPTTVDLMARALASALAGAGMAAGELGAVITATSTPARVTGANAPAVAEALGVHTAAFDVRSGCSGGVLSLVQGCMWAAATGRPVGVVAADTFSKILPPGHPLAAMAFGDGAGAAILVPVVLPDDGGAGLLSAAFDSDGSLGQLATAPSPFPVTHEHIDAGRYYLQGSAEELAERAPALYAAVIDEALAAAGLGAGDIDRFIPHQTSRPAIESLARAAGIALERTVITCEEHGNCGAAGVYIALDRARRDGLAAAGQTLLFAALGGGLSWGAAVFRA